MRMLRDIYMFSYYVVSLRSIYMRIAHIARVVRLASQQKWCAIEASELKSSVFLGESPKEHRRFEFS